MNSPGRSPQYLNDVEDRFGVLPNFFQLTPDTPEITENLWGFAKFGYLDNPLPALFKERLFVYLSQFCEVKYCIARHVGFLVGLGNPSGDHECPPDKVEDVVQLLQWPIPSEQNFDELRLTLEEVSSPLKEMPEPQSEIERAIFGLAAHIFRQSQLANPALEVLQRSVDPAQLQYLLVFLTFVRSAHFWTQVHPELRQEEDLQKLFSIHESLASCVLEQNAESDGEATARLLEELEDLRKEKEHADFLRVTLASIGDAVIATDPSGKVTAINAVAEELTGWRAAEANGEPLDVVFRIVNEQTRQTVESPARRALREGVIVGLANHTILISKDNREHPIDDSAAPIRSTDGTIVGCVLVFRDVTQRRESERALMKSEERYRALISATSQIVWTTNSDGLAVDDSPTWRKFTGQTYDEWKGAGWLDAVHPDDRDQTVQQWQSAVATNSNYEVVYRLRTVNGDYRWTSARGIPVLDKDGSIREWVGMNVDITESKRVEDERSRLASIVHYSSDFIGVADPAGNPLFINPAGRQLVGLSETSDIKDTAIPDYFVPEEREFVQSVVMPVIETEGRWSGELTFRNFQTEEAIPVWFDFFRVDHPVTGEPLNLATVTRDMTERKQADKDLRESEERFRTLADGISQFAWMTDENGWIFWYNQRWFDYTGTTEEEMQGWGWQAVHHPDYVDGVTAKFRKAIETGEPWEDTFPLKGKSGEFRWFLSRAHPIRDENGTIIRWFGTNTDIEELKRAEAKTQRYSDQLRELADISARIGIAHDIESLLGIVVEEARSVIGSHQSVVSLTVDSSWRQSINSVSLSEKYAEWEEYESPPTGAGIYRAVCETNRPMRLTQAQLENHPEYKNFSGDVENYPPMRGWLACPIVGRDGRNLGVLQLSDKFEGDFTEDDEAILLQLAQLTGVALENAWLVQDFKDADRKKDEFLATLAHELRNPLAPVRTGLQALKMVEEDADAREEICDTMERQVQQMVRLIDDLLDVSRITRGKMELRKCRIAIAEIVQSAVEATRPFIDEAGHYLTVNLPEKQVDVDGDPNRLAQVIANLLNNASKYTPEGGHIWLEVIEAENDRVAISVRDNGLGIPAKMLNEIFDMFTQIDRPLEKGYTGLGIGLTLVKRLVEMHEGNIEVFSEGANRGSEFRVVLPRLTDTVARQSDPGSTTTSPSKLRVLIVDDNTAAANMLKMVVKMMGNDVQTAQDGLEGTRLADEFRPHVILMDLGMPVMDGYEAAQKIRNEEWGQEMLLVALTGWGQEDDRRRTEAAGFDHHLVKPAEPLAIQEILNAYLSSDDRQK